MTGDSAGLVSVRFWLGGWCWVWWQGSGVSRAGGQARRGAGPPRASAAPGGGGLGAAPPSNRFVDGGGLAWMGEFFGRFPLGFFRRRLLSPTGNLPSVGGRWSRRRHHDLFVSSKRNGRARSIHRSRWPRGRRRARAVPKRAKGGCAFMCGWVEGWRFTGHGSHAGPQGQPEIWGLGAAAWRCATDPPPGGAPRLRGLSCAQRRRCPWARQRRAPRAGAAGRDSGAGRSPHAGRAGSIGRRRRGLPCLVIAPRRRFSPLLL